MKNLKLFPKTFLYVFSLMAAVALISHALFYFLMPVVYSGQKENQFLAAKVQLMEELKNASPDKIQRLCHGMPFGTAWVFS